MENITVSEGTNSSQFIDHKAAVVMWKVLPPLILVLGTFGNLFTILVMSRIKDNNSSQYAILMALAMADICVLYTGLLPLWFRRVFRVYVTGTHSVLCKLTLWATYGSNTTSAWLVTTVTVQRTMAVLWPHRMRMMCTVRRTWFVIAVVVVIAWSVHLHIVFGYYLNPEKYCMTSGKYKQFFRLTWEWVDMYASSIVPSICLFVCSVILSWTLFKSTSVLSADIPVTSKVSGGNPRDGRTSNAVKVTVMILALACTFFILTVPVCIYNIWDRYDNVFTLNTTASSEVFRSVTNFMWLSNSAVNFLLYCLTGSRFRKEFLSLLLCSR